MCLMKIEFPAALGFLRRQLLADGCHPKATQRRCTQQLFAGARRRIP